MLSKERFFTVLIGVSTLGSTITGDVMRNARNSMVFSQPREISKDFQRLLSVSGIKPPYTFEQVVVQTQRAWLRPADRERWQLSEVDHPQRNRMWQLVTELGFVKEITPMRQKYDYAVVLGTRGGSLCSRFHFLYKQMQQGVRFHQLVILTGQRQLDSSIESPRRVAAHMRRYFDVDVDVPESLKTETDMIYFLLNNLPCFQAMRDRAVVVDAPSRVVGEKILRPRTKETVEAWLEQSPQPGTCLVVSSQPHVWYQDAVMRSYMPADFDIETVGPSTPDDTLLAECLDAVARFLYQTYHYL